VSLAPSTARPDIQGPNDLDRLLRHFYGLAFADDLLRHVFIDVIDMDLEAHLPAISAFWERVLFGTGSYTGRPLAQHRAVHVRVRLTDEHFRRWLTLWRTSLTPTSWDLSLKPPTSTLSRPRRTSASTSTLWGQHAACPCSPGKLGADGARFVRHPTSDASTGAATSRCKPGSWSGF
jgi:hemoglobin